MENFKNIVKEGDFYTIKTNKVQYIIAALLLLGFGGYIAYRQQNLYGMIWLAAMALFAFYYLGRIFSISQFDLDKGIFIYKASMFSPFKEYKLNQLTNIYLSNKIYLLFLNSRAFLVFHDGVKEHQIRASQYFMSSANNERTLMEIETLLKLRKKG